MASPCRFQRGLEPLKRADIGGVSDTHTPGDSGALRGSFPESNRPTRISVSDVVVPEGEEVRGDALALRTLADSITQLGQLMPIIISTDGSIVAGRRRLAAHKLLGKKKILAIVRDCTPDEAELIEIDENFARQELTVLERAVQMARRRELYEARSNGSGKRVAEFAEDAASASGVSKRTVQRLARIGQDLTPEAVAILHGTPVADSTQTLMKVSRLSPAEQAEVARRLVEGGSLSPKEEATEVLDNSAEAKNGEAVDTLPEAVVEEVIEHPGDGDEVVEEAPVVESIALPAVTTREEIVDDLGEGLPDIEDVEDAYCVPEWRTTEHDRGDLPGGETSAEAVAEIRSEVVYGDATLIVASPFWAATGISALEASAPFIARDAVLYTTIPATQLGMVAKLLATIQFDIDGVVGAWATDGAADSGFISPDGILVRFVRGVGIESDGPLEMGLQAGFGRPLSPPVVINTLLKYLRDVHPYEEAVDLFEIVQSPA